MVTSSSTMPWMRRLQSAGSTCGTMQRGVDPVEPVVRGDDGRESGHAELCAGRNRRRLHRRSRKLQSLTSGRDRRAASAHDGAADGGEDADHSGSGRPRDERAPLHARGLLGGQWSVRILRAGRDPGWDALHQQPERSCRSEPRDGGGNPVEGAGIRPRHRRDDAHATEGEHHNTTPRRPPQFEQARAPRPRSRARSRSR